MIAAESLEIAEEAAELVQIDYEDLPAIYDAEAAFEEKPIAVLHPALSSYRCTSNLRYPVALVPERPNVCSLASLRTGDVKSGFDRADLIVENKYQWEAVQHCPLETHVLQAWVDLDGAITLRVSRQGYFLLQNHLAQFFHLPLTKIRILGSYVGGGFGSKANILFETLVTIAAIKFQRPVSLRLSREEEFSLTGVRPQTTVYLKHGVNKDGRLLALEAKIIINAGAYAADKIAILTRSALSALVPTYQIDNVKVDSYAVYTNLPPSTTMRGVQTPEVVWGIEQQMDIIAEKLGMNSVELRKKNILEPGNTNAMGEVVESIGVRECLDKVLEWIDWGKKPVPRGDLIVSKGYAIGGKLSGRGYSATSTVKLNSDGTLEVGYGSGEIGQGAHTVVAQIVAEEFDVPISKVKVLWGDTNYSPWDWDNQSSRTTLGTGNAVLRACQDAKYQIRQLAAARMGLAASDVAVGHGMAYHKDYPSTSTRLENLFSPSGIVRGIGVILGRGEFTSIATAPSPSEIGHFEKFSFWGYAAYAVEIGINKETGQIFIIKIAGAFDVGQPINLKMCEQQIEGGMGMGIGTALYEELKYKDGKLLNPDFVNYKLPTFVEVPCGKNAASFVVRAPHKEGPYGAKGVGESILVGLAPAIANAVYNGTGVRLFHAPLTRERVLEALSRSVKARTA